ncbi:UTP--glucose-1-phosphate uridylyltransferase GalU [Chloroflexota bacterium]
MEVKKAVITAAGLGTRFMPATKAQSKEMLPLVDRPLIQYAVEECAASGIEQVIIVTRPNTGGFKQHFEPSADLERILEEKGKTEQLEKIRRVSGLARVDYVCQQQQLGLGHAILMAKDAVGNEPFVVILPDDIIDGDVPAIAQMKSVYDRYSASVVAVERVPKEKVSSYGVVNPEPIDGKVSRVLGLVEKPAPDEAPSDLCIVGRYIFTPEIFAMIEKTPRGAIGEIQITDAMHLLLAEQSMYAYRFDGVRYDTGTPLGMLKASVELGLKNADFGEDFRGYLKRLEL